MAGTSPMNRRKYRGRPRGGGSVVLKIIIVLLVLVILACILFFTVMGGYVEYTDDGVRIVSPWGQNGSDSSSEPQISAPIIVVE